MSDNEIRIAIAEALGWKIEREGEHCLGWLSPNHGRLLFDFVPDYTNDLNAIHEAWSTLNDDQKKAFYRHLSNAEGMTRLVYKNVLTQDWLVVGATARQRAEAFLRTIGNGKNPTPENEGAKSE